MPEYFVLAPWEWIDRSRPINRSDAYVGWDAPHAQYRVGGFDLRSALEKDMTGQMNAGWGIFVYDRPVTMGGSEIQLGTDWDDVLTAAQKSGIEGVTGLRPTEITLRSIFRQFMGDSAFYSPDSDLDGINPLTIGLDMRVKAWLGSRRIVDEPADQLSIDAHIARFQNVFRKQIQGGGYTDDEMRKWAAATSMQIYRRLDDEAVNSILPSEYQGFGWTRPTSTETDTMDDDDTAPMTGWTVECGHGFSSTAADGYAKNSNDSDECNDSWDNALSTDAIAVYGQIETIINKIGGFCNRHHDTNQSCYVFGVRGDGVTGGRIGELSASGGLTTHQSPTNLSDSNQVLGGECGITGSDDLELFEDYNTAKISKATHTDTTLFGQRKMGIWASFGGDANRCRIANITGTDIVVGGSLAHRRRRNLVTR